MEYIKKVDYSAENALLHVLAEQLSKRLDNGRFVCTGKFKRLVR